MAGGDDTAMEDAGLGHGDTGIGWGCIVWRSFAVDHFSFQVD